MSSEPNFVEDVDTAVSRLRQSLAESAAQMEQNLSKIVEEATAVFENKTPLFFGLIALKPQLIKSPKAAILPEVE